VSKSNEARIRKLFEDSEEGESSAGALEDGNTAERERLSAATGREAARLESIASKPKASNGKIPNGEQTLL